MVRPFSARKGFAWTTAACSLLSLTAFADGLSIETPWALSLPAVSKNGAVYLIIRNHASETDDLIGGDTPMAQRVELHRHILQDGKVMMHRVEAVGIPGNGSVSFEPGGYHLMLMGLRHSLDAGYRFPLTLRFRRSAELSVQVQVLDALPGPHHDMDGHGNPSGVKQEQSPDHGDHG